MVLDNYRSTLDWWLVPLARSFRRIHPDVFTWFSLAFAILAGVAFWQSDPHSDRGLSLLLAGWILVIANSVFDLLDGKVAHMTGRASPRGDYLDHACDRFSDAAILLGIAFSPWASREAGLVAIVATLLASYMGTQAQAVGLKRNYGGLLGRADRMVLIMAVPLVEFAQAKLPLDYPPASLHPGLTWFGLMLWYFGIMAGLTTLQRFVKTLRSFGANGQLPDEPKRGA
ncbi:MAG TPA: CDP-alcohol phosphatidyltransferase family protein [Candidatus Thermoplasmatota archaeon]|nr:CDP-alcohol phosphatidyltransferase family protein [Candidatus Thermoplasmatota archaeon]